jgi:hypothetical protein
MSSKKPDLAEIAASFAEIARLAHVDLEPQNLRRSGCRRRIERPSSLPPGEQAVYAFMLDDVCLKVGKAGPKTQARFTSRHYGQSAPSTLSKSVLRERARLIRSIEPSLHDGVQRLDIGSVGSWLERTRLGLTSSFRARPATAR